MPDRYIHTAPTVDDQAGESRTGCRANPASPKPTCFGSSACTSVPGCRKSSDRECLMLSGKRVCKTHFDLRNGKASICSCVRKSQLAETGAASTCRCRSNERKQKYGTQRKSHRKSPKLCTRRPDVNQLRFSALCIVLVGFRFADRKFLDRVTGLKSRSKPAGLFSASDHVSEGSFGLRYFGYTRGYLRRSRCPPDCVSTGSSCCVSFSGAAESIVFQVPASRMSDGLIRPGLSPRGAATSRRRTSTQDSTF